MTRVNRVNIVLLILMTVTALTACTVPPARKITSDIDAVKTNLPENWTWQAGDLDSKNLQNKNLKNKTSENQTFARPLPIISWWKQYQNASLNQLVTKALQQNLSLQIAALSITQAQQKEAAQNQQRGVQLGGSTGASLAATLRDGAQVRQSYSGSINASYLFDFWDKLQLSANNAAAEIAATEEDFLAARLAVTGAVVQRYLQITYLNEQLRLNQAQLRHAQKNAQFTQAKFDAGTASKLEMVQAQAPITALKSTRAQLENDKKQQLTALGAILGESQPARIDPQDLSGLTFALPQAGVPAAVLARRPDLRAQQWRLQQVLTGIAIAERDFYPSLTLGGNVGVSAGKLWRILQDPTAALTGSLTLPFLQYQEKVLTQKQAEIAYQQALKQFQQKLLEALSEVQQALLGVAQAQEEEKFAATKAKQTAEILRLERVRYDAGTISLQTLLDSEQNHRDSEAAIVRSRYEKLLRSVQLFLALGGEID